jgi:hypothetical protein
MTMAKKLIKIHLDGTIHIEIFNSEGVSFLVININLPVMEVETEKEDIFVTK